MKRRATQFDRLLREARDAEDALTWAENEKRQGGIAAMLQGPDVIQRAREISTQANAALEQAWGKIQKGGT